MHVEKSYNFFNNQEYTMRTLTDEQKATLENKTKYITLKNNLLKNYHAYADELEYAIDDVEEGIIRSKREKLAKKIKALSETLREIESLEKSV
jgi:hypothetical protein